MTTTTKIVTDPTMTPFFDFAAACNAGHRISMLTMFYFHQLQSAHPDARAKLANYRADEDKADELAHAAEAEIYAVLQTTKRS